MSKLVKLLINPTNDPVNIASTFTNEELEQVIIYTADKYYNTDKPLLSDTTFDILEK